MCVGQTVISQQLERRNNKSEKPKEKKAKYLPKAMDLGLEGFRLQVQRIRKQIGRTCLPDSPPQSLIRPFCSRWISPGEGEWEKERIHLKKLMINPEG